MPNALESDDQPVKLVKHPHRRDQQPRVLTILDRDNLAHGVLTIIRAIKDHRRRYGCGSYLFIDQTMTAYVITEEQSVAHDWIRNRFASLVGLYCPVAHQRGLNAPPGVPEGLTVTVDGVTEDVTEHLAGLQA